jgi:hypothetical protein
VATQNHPEPDLEWWMHYQIPEDELHLHQTEDCEVKDSTLKPSTTFPSSSPGRGLFTKVARKTGDMIVAFPGYWMEENTFGHEDPTQQGNHYAFSVPEDWGSMPNLVYVTHNSQANFINAGVIGSEVCMSLAFPLVCKTVCICSAHTCRSWHP